MGLGKIRTNQFLANAALFHCAVLAYNTVRWMAQATIAGIETAHMIRKGQLSEENMPAYKQFIALAG
ncbi:hypothetical protein BAZMOX_518265_0 [methanotrophic endosymbiont of Bathymodiolus azoricus (Menez Gwen)]|nr:hypothetical protein BAZMOX_518265_0 [methanotrophic endosymbiont of Bathymodiolus azoricus (Menez Gwen)]